TCRDRARASASWKWTCRRSPRKRSARRHPDCGCSLHWRSPRPGSCAHRPPSPASRKRGCSSPLPPCGPGSGRRRGSASARSRGWWCPPPALPFRRRGAELSACSSALTLLVGGVAGEVARGRELAELVADHVLVDRDRDELL